MRSNRDVLNESNPNKLASSAQAIKLGNALALMPAFVSGSVSSNRLTLPNAQKALAVLFAYSRTGTLTQQLVPIATGATPATGQVGVSPTGDILFATADAVTSADVVYLPAEGEIVTETLPVVSNVATPLQGKEALILLSATVTIGGSVGAKTVTFRGAAVGAGQAAVTDTGTIAFASADAATQATVTYIAKPSAGSAARSLKDALAADVAL
jgi:hypothetical protein